MLIEKLLMPVIFTGVLILAWIVHPTTRTWFAVGIAAARELLEKHRMNRMEKQNEKEDDDGKEGPSR